MSVNVSQKSGATLGVDGGGNLTEDTEGTLAFTATPDANGQITKIVISGFSAGWSVDEQGFERMESGFHASARDFARFGLLYLNQGKAGDRQLMPEGWIDDSTDTDTHIELEKYDGRQWGYRAGWWIVPRPDGRSDYCAIGHFGQFIYISPQFDAVFVRNGPGRGEWGDRDWTALFYFMAERLGQASTAQMQSNSRIGG